MSDQPSNQPFPDQKVTQNISGELAARIIDCSPAIIVSMDLNFRITAFNHAAEKTFGYSAEEMIGARAANLFANYEEAKLAYQQVLETGSFYGEILNVRKNGEVFPILLSSSPLLDGEGWKIGYIGTARDITEQKKSREQQLRASERLRQIAQITNSVINSVPFSEQGRYFCERVRATFGFDACVIRILEKDELVLLASMGIPESSLSPVIPVGWGLTDKILKNRQAIFISDVADQPTPVLSTLSNSFQFTSYAGAPLLVGNQVVGIISIYSVNKAENFSTTEMEHLQIVANHVSVAIVNDRLFKEVKGQKEQLERESTVRADTEKELSKSDERFQKLTKAVNDAVWDYDLGTNELWWSEAFETLFGYKREEIESGIESWKNRVHPEDFDRVISRFESAIARGDQLWVEEYRFRKADGAYAVVYDRGYLIRDSSGKTVRVIGAMIDITKSKRVEQTVRLLSLLGQQLSSTKSHEAAARIIGEILKEQFNWDACTMDLYLKETNQVVSLFTVDTIDGKRVDVNPTYCSQPPSKRMRRILDSGAELLLKEKLNFLSEAIPFGQNRPSATIMLVPIRNQSESVGIISIHSYTPGAYNQDDLNTLQTLADYCGGALERIRAEMALKSSEMRFHSVWENSVDGMRLTDENGIIVAVNSAFCNLVGMEREELEGKPFTVVYAETENGDAFLSKYKIRFQNRIIEKLANRRIMFRNNRSADLEIANSFIELRGEENLLLGLFRDVTAQRRMEEELRHSQKMESIGQLAGGIAHDFNNILTVIRGHAMLIETTDHIPESGMESVKQITHAADRAAGLTQQLLTFSRKQVVKLKSLNINDVVANMNRMLQRILGEDISLEVDFLPELPEVLADSGMIEQILLNLAVNSRDAMPNGGRLLVRTETLMIDAATAQQNVSMRPGLFVCLTVQDTGCGIPAHILPRIFEPFFTTKDVGKGTGLGLATVYGIVRQHSGWVNVISENNQGATFRIFLPSVQSKSEEPKSKPVETPQKGNETILLVEDEGEVRGLAKIILQRLGYHVLEAASGNDAKAIWDKHKTDIDLLFTDMVMPGGINGWELAQQLLQEDPALKVIFTSGYSRETVGKDFIKGERDNFLQKPYTPQKLSQIIRRRLDGEPGIAEEI